MAGHDVSGEPVPDPRQLHDAAGADRLQRRMPVLSPGRITPQYGGGVWPAGERQQRQDLQGQRDALGVFAAERVQVLFDRRQGQAQLPDQAREIAVSLLDLPIPARVVDHALIHRRAGSRFGAGTAPRDAAPALELPAKGRRVVIPGHRYAVSRTTPAPREAVTVTGQCPRRTADHYRPGETAHLPAPPREIPGVNRE
jgi:hypothetical protein